MTINIAWITSRKAGMFGWFCDSLHRECGGNYDDIRVIKVDYYEQACDKWTKADVAERHFRHHKRIHIDSTKFKAVSPKPTVWQGAHRLTKGNFFCASNARNTALCYAEDGWIAYVDDLSILMPGWLGAVRRAMKHNYIACGAFRKVLNLKYENDKATFDDHPAGKDSRWDHGKDDKAIKCAPNWLFGCSLAAPVNAFLKINGWPEVADSTGVGAEDCFVGMALAATGHQLRYDRRMFTLESEERHHQGDKMLRIDKGAIGTPDSKSHALVRMLDGCKWFPNDFGPFPDLAALRQHILNGGQFPIINRPTVDWYDKMDLRYL